MTTTEAAERLGCTQQHVRRLVAAGRLRGRAINKRLYLVEAASVDAYAATEHPKGWPRGKPRKAGPVEDAPSGESAPEHPQ